MRGAEVFIRRQDRRKAPLPPSEAASSTRAVDASDALRIRDRECMLFYLGKTRLFQLHERGRRERLERWFNRAANRSENQTSMIPRRDSKMEQAVISSNASSQNWPAACGPSGRMDSPPITTMGMTARIHELEEEMRSLRKLVCHLLQKNELLRQRPQNRNDSSQ
jgi:hypothetical protein